MTPSFAAKLERAALLAVVMTVGCGSDWTFRSLTSQEGSQQLAGQRPLAMTGLTPVGRVADTTLIDVAVALPLRNKSERDTLSHDLYDPLSPHYRHFLTPDEYTEKFGPSVESYQAVLDFADKNQLTVVWKAPGRQHVHLRGSAAAINRAFHVILQLFMHPTEQRIFYGPDRDPSIDVDVPIAAVIGLDDFHHAANAPASQAGGSGPNGSFTGNDFRKAYAPGVTLTGTGQTIGILNVGGNYLASDITAYENNNGLPNVTLQNVYLAGYTAGPTVSCPPTGFCPDLEISSDIELALSMAPGVRQITIYGINGDNASIIDALSEMVTPTQGEPLPNQISTSFAINYGTGSSGQYPVFNYLSQLVTQGQALFASSGDTGSYNETNGTGDFPPSDDPHIVSVGGTLLTTNTDGTWNSETAWGGSGGGWSPWAPATPEFDIPSWQVGMNFALFGGSPISRNVPDVSMVALNISTFFNGASSGFGGTSASSPLWAGFMALVNQQAQRSIGLPTPALYSIGGSGFCGICFNDITTGNNFNATNPTSF